MHSNSRGPQTLEPMLCNKRRHCNEKPRTATREQPPLSTTRESPRSSDTEVGRGSGTHEHMPGPRPNPQLSWGSFKSPQVVEGGNSHIVSTQPAPLHLDLQEQCPSETPRASNLHQTGDRICRASDSEKYQELQVVDLRTLNRAQWGSLSVASCVGMGPWPDTLSV